MNFSDEQIHHLESFLDGTKVRERTQAGRRLSYIEGWWAIKRANEIFGFERWDRSTEFFCIEQTIAETTSKSGRKMHVVSYNARVTIEVTDPDGDQVLRQGCGTGHGMGGTPGEAHESAIKEAETDATKRALMTFGNQFGLALYDKDQKEVDANGDKQHRYREPPPKKGQSQSEVSRFLSSIGGVKDGDYWRFDRMIHEEPGMPATLGDHYVHPPAFGGRGGDPKEGAGSRQIELTLPPPPDGRLYDDDPELEAKVIRKVALDLVRDLIEHGIPSDEYIKGDLTKMSLGRLKGIVEKMRSRLLVEQKASEVK